MERNWLTVHGWREITENSLNQTSTAICIPASWPWSLNYNNFELNNHENQVRWDWTRHCENKIYDRICVSLTTDSHTNFNNPFDLLHNNYLQKRVVRHLCYMSSKNAQFLMIFLVFIGSTSSLVVNFLPYCCIKLIPKYCSGRYLQRTCFCGAPSESLTQNFVAVLSLVIQTHNFQFNFFICGWSQWCRLSKFIISLKK